MIEVENLTKFYGDFCAVDHINLTVDKGQVLGLLGPNGAGKTTTLRMLTGYLSPSDGMIRMGDLDIETDLINIKRQIGYLPESAPIYQNMLVYDYLDYVARIRGLQNSNKNNRMKQLSEICGLKEIMHKTIGELSKGLNQRVGLAHAMMSDPEVLILDEPTSGLDPNQIVEIREIIRKIGQKKTIILSTHILSEVEAVCDRVVIINRGKIVADDSTKTLRQRQDKEQHILISLENANFDAAKEKLSPIEGVIEIRKTNENANENNKVNLLCRSENDNRSKIYECIKQTDWILTEFYKETKTLETIFRELTKEN